MTAKRREVLVKKFRIVNIFLLTTVVMLQACIVQNLLYSQIDWLAIRQFDETFEPTDEQSKIYEPFIKSWVNGVKGEVFRKVADGFAQASENAKDDFSKDDLLTLEATMVDARKVFMLPGISNSSKFLKSLSDKQLDAFKKKMQEKEDQYTEILDADESDFSDLQNDRVEEIADRMESWMGPLTKEQIALTKSFWWKDKANIKLRFERRHKVQDKLLEIIKSSSEKELSTFFTKWADDIDHLNKLTFPNEKNRLFSMRDYFLVLNKTLTPKQHRFLQERFAEIAKDLNGLLK